MTQLRLREDRLEWRLVEGEIVVLDLSTSRYIAINGSGAKLWPGLLDGATLRELSDVLANEYGLEPTRAERDVQSFVSALAEQGLLDG
jgi:hypothetical protein